MILNQEGRGSKALCLTNAGLIRAYFLSYGYLGLKWSGVDMASTRHWGQAVQF